MTVFKNDFFETVHGRSSVFLRTPSSNPTVKLLKMLLLSMLANEEGKLLPTIETRLFIVLLA